jgi:hypothetical protein
LKLFGPTTTQRLRPTPFRDPVLNAIKKPAARNRARSTLSAFFAWAIGDDLCDVNPVVGTNKAEEAGERQRVLTDDEIATVWLNCPDNSKTIPIAKAIPTNSVLMAGLPKSPLVHNPTTRVIHCDGCHGIALSL